MFKILTSELNSNSFILLLMKKFLNTEHAFDLNFKKDLIENQLAAKEIYVANYYIKTQKWASRFFIFGIFLFSGSIYLITLKEFFSFNTKIFTILTPIGGLFLITGWLRLAYGIIVNK